MKNAWRVVPVLVCSLSVPWSHAMAGSIGSVTPSGGPFAGGDMVTISGVGLGSGCDITNVTLCGAVAAIQTQSVDSVVVLAGAAVSWGTGAVVVVSGSMGATTGASAYAYSAPGYIHGAFLGWTSVSNLPAPRGWIGAAAVGRRIYSVGGADGGGRSDVYTYDSTEPEAGWNAVSNLPMSFSSMAAASVGGTLYAVSGSNVFAFETGHPEHGWGRLADLPAARNYPGVASADGRLYVMAGFQATPHLTFYEYDPSEPAAGWSVLADLPEERSGMPGFGLNGRVYAVGGRTSTTSLSSVCEFDCRNRSGGWTSLPDLPESRSRYGATALAGKLYVIGGQDAFDVTRDTVYCFDPVQPGDGWTSLDPLPAARYVLGAASDGESIYAIGGILSASAEEEVFRGSFASGVSPSSGPTRGSNIVVVSGTRLGNGTDITNVTLCGVSAAILSQSATQVVVRAGAAAVAGCGDVTVFSATQGCSVRSGAYTYEGVTLYVDAGCATPLAPYTNWAIAATSIQDAVDAAWPYDTVMVTNGAYASGGCAWTGNVTLARVCVTNAVTVRSVNGPAVTTLVGATDPDTGGHGTNAFRCAYVSAGGVLSGFSLTGGWTRADGSASTSRAGGGAFVGVGGVVSNCVVSSNRAAGNGGGVYCSSGGELLASTVLGNTAAKGGGAFVLNGTIRGCEIRGNYSTNTGGGVQFNTAGVVEDSVVRNNRAITDGGGVLLTGDAIVRNCVVSSNRADGTFGTGGGVMLYYGGVLESSAVCSNFASYSGGGVAIYGGDGQMDNCLVYRNTCASYGGGLYCYAGGRPVVNCTIVSNHCSYYYGGVSCNYTGVFHNTIIYYNTAVSGCPEIGGNAGLAYNSCISTLTSGLAVAQGCITNAPQFVNGAAADFRLLQSSPCRDSGSNALVVGTTDLPGVRRIIGPRVDMGAYEYGTATNAVAPPSIHEPRIVDAGASGVHIVTNQTSLSIAGTKPVDTWTADPFLTNGLTQTWAENSWSHGPFTLSPTVPGEVRVFTYATVKTNLYTVSEGDTTLTVVNYRVPPTISIANGNGAVTYDVAQTDIAGSHSLAVGMLRWTNSLGGGGTFAAEPCWTVAGLSLKVGKNIITVSGTNALGTIGSASITVDRGAEGTGVPAVTITNAPAWVAYNAGSAQITGSDLNIAGQLKWVNSRVPGSTNAFNVGFSATVNNLQFGQNEITIEGTNVYGVRASDSVAVWRQTMEDRTAVTNYVWGGNPGTPVAPYATWATAATTLQDAVAAAITDGPTGTVIIVTNGTYTVPSPWISLTNTIHLVSVNGPEVTIVDGGMPAVTGRCFTINNAMAVLEGFTISNAHWTANGGGVYIGLNGGTIQRCIFTHCQAGDKGGGVYLNKAGAIDACLFSECAATNWGGAVHLEQGGEVRRSVMVNGAAGLYGGGASIYAGGRLYSCLIVSNFSNRGGGIYTRYFPSRFDNCTIVSNSATIEGGGLYIREGPTMRASIVYGNDAPAGTNCLTYGTVDVFNSCTYPSLGSGCVTNDPAFVDFAAGDFHLTSSSPCIDAAVNLAWMSGEVDLDSVPIPLDGNADGTATADIGAYEFIHPTADSDGDGLSDSNELCATHTSPVDANCDDDPANDGEEYIADTDPLDPLSYFHIDAFSNSVPSNMVCFLSSAARVYSLEYTTNLVGGAWTNVVGQTNICGCGGATILCDTNGPSPRFYRVEVRVP